MSIISKIFSRGDQFFDLLELSAEQVHKIIQALVVVFKEPKPEISIENFLSLKLKEKQITQEIEELLINVFATGLEREDIEELSTALYRITKNVEKFAERYVLFNEHCDVGDFIPQIQYMESCTSTLVQMVKSLRGHPPLEKIKALKMTIDQEENSADDLMSTLLQDLYSGNHSTVKLLVIKDLYSLLEKIIDRTRDAAHIVYLIVLKNS